MSQRKIGKSWWVDFRFKFTRYRKKSPLNTAQGARDYEATLRSRLGRGEPLEPRAALPVQTFAEFAADWFETYVKTNNKPSDQHSKRSTLDAHLLPWFGTLKLGAVAGRPVETYKAARLADGLCAKTVNNHLNILSACLRRAVEWGHLPAMPRIPRLRADSRRIDFLTDDERQSLLSAADGRDGLPVLLALDAGLRVGEILGLRWTDVDFEHARLTIERAWVQGAFTTTKSNRVRHVPLTLRLRATLWASRRSDGLLFPANGDTPMSYSGARHLLERACDRAGIRRVGWHTLRHTFATRLGSLGVPLRVFQEYLGHGSVKTTERYAHLLPAVHEEAIHVLDQPTPTRSPWATGGQWPVLEPSRPLTRFSSVSAPDLKKTQELGTITEPTDVTTAW